MTCIALLLITASARAADTAPATLPAPATDPALPEIKTKFEAGDPIDDLLNSIAQKYEVVVIKPKPTEAMIPKNVELPPTLDDAVDLAQKILEAQGLGLVRSVSGSGHLVLKMGTRQQSKEAEQLQSPVTTGSDPAKIDISKPNRLVTHLLVIQHSEMIESLRRTATQDKNVDISLTGSAAIGYTMIFTGPALRVQQAAEAVIKIDGQPNVRTAARAITLLHLNAVDAANTLNATFAREANGMKAVADVRTNTVVITGPPDLVPQAAVNLIGMDGYTGVRPNLQNGVIPDFTPPPQPSPSGPGGRGPDTPGTLDGMAASGDNASLNHCPIGPLEKSANVSINVNKPVLLKDSEQLVTLCFVCGYESLIQNAIRF